MKNFIALFLLIVFPLTTFASNELSYYPETFRQQYTNQTVASEALKNNLFIILTGLHARNSAGDIIVTNCIGQMECYSQIALEYDEAKRNLFGKLHLKQDSQGYYVEDLYCQRKIRKTKAPYVQVGPMQIPDKEINCEHTWPQSKFTKSFSEKMQKGDLHHLYPVNIEANSTRGNYPFGSDPEVIGEHTAYQQLDNLNNCDSSRMLQIAKEGQFFEPPASHRGNVARSLFYFSVRYKLSISETQEKFLRLWNSEDPIDAEELNRNNQVFEIQKNRNPFVDFPDLTDKITNF